MNDITWPFDFRIRIKLFFLLPYLIQEINLKTGHQLEEDHVYEAY